MSRKPKTKIIELLKAKNVVFDEKAKYDVLYDLLKSSESYVDIKPGAVIVGHIPARRIIIDNLTKEETREREIHEKKGFSLEIIRVARKAGFVYEQIEAYDSEESLRSMIGRIKPAILASAGRISEPRPAPKPVELETKKLSFNLELSPMRAKTILRADDEQRSIEAFINRRGIMPAVTRIEIIRHYEPLPNNKYSTEITIYYKGPKHG